MEEEEERMMTLLTICVPIRVRYAFRVIYPPWTNALNAYALRRPAR